MDDLSRMLAETMNAAAGDAPSDAGLLRSVRQRSDRNRRRRITAGLSAAAAVLSIGVPVAIVVASRPDPAAPPPAAPASPTNARKLISAYSLPAFPYTLPATAGMRAPVASADHGNLLAFFEATELRHHSDITITVTGRRPSFTTSATETPKAVRGHPGTLRTVDVSPANKLTLSWQESPSRWIQLATDDTYTPNQVVALADALAPASIRVSAPFSLGLAPSGLTATTVTASRLGFGTPGTDGLTVVLRKRQELTGPNAKIGNHPARLTHRTGGATLAIDVTDWAATLEVTADAGLGLTDADLLRFAAGIHILDRSNPE